MKFVYQQQDYLHRCCSVLLKNVGAMNCSYPVLA